MKPGEMPLGPNAVALTRTEQALRLVCAEMPHLAGLAHLVRIQVHPYFPVAAVGASGLVCVNPDVFARIPLVDAAFVLAHELLHLALDTHGREGQADPHLVNVAHDFVINDMLTDEIGRAVPLGGLVRSGARNESLEELIVELSKDRKTGKVGCWARAEGRGGMRAVGRVSRRSPRRWRKPGWCLPSRSLAPARFPLPPRLSGKAPRGDLLSNRHETTLEPEVSPEQRRQLREAIRKAAARALSLGALRAKIDESQKTPTLPEPQRGEILMKAVHAAYQPPWQLALQRWMDAVAPAGRSYARASRRGADRDDIVLCGRVREGWTLHIVLDTSGSMAGVLPRVLGAIASFCDGAGVGQIHILQCDIEVTRDEWLEPAQLAEYRVAGFGGSDMSPGLLRLAEDTEVSAVLVLTDGYIEYPTEEQPYRVLWAIFRSPDGYAASFEAPYGEVIFLDP